MRAVGYWMRRVVRAQLRSTLFLSLIVAAASGAMLTVAAGAERTASAPDRYTVASGGGFDAEVQQEGGPPRTSEVAALPGVSSVEAVTFVFATLNLAGSSGPADALVFSGSPRAFGTRLVSGRLPDPASTQEFIATRSFAMAKGVAVGATFDLRSLTQKQADAAGFDSFSTERPDGPSLEAVLVGVIDGPATLDDPSPLAVLPPSLLDIPDLGVAATIMSVRLQPGTDLATFRAKLDSLPAGATFRLKPSELISSQVRAAVAVQGRALGLLAVVGAAAAVVVLGQLITRSVRLSADEESSLKAIGFSRGQLLMESAGRAGVSILTGTVGGAALSTIPSSSFPTGFVRRIEPHPGLRVDVSFLTVCVAGLLMALLLWTVAALVLARPLGRAERPSPLVESVAARCGSAPVSTGLRLAFTRGRRDRGSVRAALMGMLVAASILVGGIVFGSSLGRLVTDGARFGNNFDLLFGSGGDAVPDELRTRLEADADVAGLMLYAVGEGRVGPKTLGLAGMEPVKGDLAPRILAGRLPSAVDEIALGRLAAHRLGAKVGGDLTVDSNGQAQQYRVTGLAVVPPVGGLDGVGQDAVVTQGGLTRLDPAAKPSSAAITLRRGAPTGTAARLGLDQNQTNDPPSVILNLARIRSSPFLLAWLVGASAVLTVIHVMVTSVRNRRRDVAVLRALGADGRWITRTVHWQATLFSIVPLVVGVPLGLIAGRVVFVLFANSIGAVPDPSLPFARLTAVVAGGVVLANAAAAFPALRARRLAPWRLLTGE